LRRSCDVSGYRFSLPCPFTPRRHQIPFVHTIAPSSRKHVSTYCKSCSVRLRKHAASSAVVDGRRVMRESTRISSRTVGVSAAAIERSVCVRRMRFDLVTRVSFVNEFVVDELAEPFLEVRKRTGSSGVLC